ncbi:MAG: outer membrane protein assembly factor BamE [Clostridia bacterium]|nr:outer membrane protein assembly factor BamE [Clostridia bacterium]
MGFIYIVILVVLIVWCVETVQSGNKFRDSSRRIQQGMTVKDVVGIMGPPSFQKQHLNGSFEYVYEKSEWKGWFRGGTAVRRMEVVFDPNGIVISVGRNENCDKSGW